jgi:hypothetical protein
VDLLGELLLYVVAEKVLDVVFAKWPLALTEFDRSGTFHHFQRSTIASRWRWELRTACILSLSTARASKQFVHET